MEETGRGTKPVKPKCTYMPEMVTLVIPLALGAMQRNPYLNHRQRSPNYGQKGAHVYKKLVSGVKYLGMSKITLYLKSKQPSPRTTSPSRPSLLGLFAG